MRNLIFIFTIIALFAGDSTFADSTSGFIDQGNRAWLSGNYDEAIKNYDEAGVNAPESPYIYFNKGTALYKKGDFQGAINEFEKAALKSKEPQMEAKCRYNLGNCTFREAERQMDSDLEKAMELCQKSIVHYQDALKLDHGLEKAAENIEIVRLMMKNILDEIKKQEEEAKEREQQAKENTEELLKLIRRQEDALEKNRKESEKKMTPFEKNSALNLLADEQGSISEDTQKFADKIKGQTAQQNQEGESSALTHLNNAVKEQLAAEGNLRNSNTPDAQKNQENALKELKDALTPDEKDQNNQAQGKQKQDAQQNEQADKGAEGEDKKEDNSNQPENRNDAGEEDQPGDEETQVQQKGVDPQDILDEETDNRKDRRLNRPGRYSDVDKCW